MRINVEGLLFTRSVDVPRGYDQDLSGHALAALLQTRYKARLAELYPGATISVSIRPQEIGGIQPPAYIEVFGFDDPAQEEKSIREELLLLANEIVNDSWLRE